MGLAPYGKPIFKDVIKKKLIDIKEDGTFRLNLKYFDYATGLKMINKKFESLFQKKTRESEGEKLTQFHMDIAASIQVVIEEIVLKIVSALANEYKSKNLCLAGGVALNCVANGKILKSGLFENIWIQPASGDAGGSLGAALAYWFKELKKERKANNVTDKMRGSYLGPNFTNKEIEKSLNSLKAKYEKFEDDRLLSIVAEEIKNEKTVGWFQGKMEFGPRALGARSIIADPRSSKMQKELNLKIKFRESFRPFAPSILKEDLNQWFEINNDSPYMLLVAKVREKHKIKISNSDEKLFGIKKLNIKRSVIPAVTHVDYSARVQTVNMETNPRYYKLLKKFKELTGCPLLVNTSFNVRGEPLVCSIEDAYNCFMGTNLDILVCENFILFKEQQDQNLLRNYKTKFKLD